MTVETRPPVKFVVWHEQRVAGRIFGFYSESEALRALRLVYPDFDPAALELQSWPEASKLSRKQSRRGFLVHPEMTYSLLRTSAP